MNNLRAIGIAPDRDCGVRAAVIGPATEARAHAAGKEVVAVAEPSTTEGLVASVVRATVG